MGASTRRFTAWTKTDILQMILRFVLGGVLIYAGVQKALDPSAFAGDLRGYRLLPEGVIFPVAAYLPFLEIVVGAALVIAFPYSGALLISGVLLVSFAFFVSSALWRGLDIECGCFGNPSDPVSLHVALWRVGVLFVVWVYLAGSLLLKKMAVVAPRKPGLFTNDVAG